VLPVPNLSQVGKTFEKALALALRVDGYERLFGFRNSAGAVQTYYINCLHISDVGALKSLTSSPNMMFVGDAVVICFTADLSAAVDHFPQPKERMWVDNTFYSILRATERHGVATFALEIVKS
jgi:hypothetical protein